MILAYISGMVSELQEITFENQALLKNAIWIDLLRPSKDEEFWVEQALGLEIPTREEMHEIELSSRLYNEDGHLFMTTIMLAHSESPEPKFDAVSFVLTERQLITIRYIEPQSFKLFTAHLKKKVFKNCQAITLFFELLDASVDRLADVLEVVAQRLDEYSKLIFRSQTDAEKTPGHDYQQLLQQIGLNGDLNTKARESLVSFHRLITFFSQVSGSRIDGEGQSRLVTLTKDIVALSDHANFLSSKINFLLDATLGMVSIEQNKIIKIFSVAAVMFLPPTLIASIYGMNFKFMPELAWHWGYFVALGTMFLSAWLPYKYFKRRKWL